MKKSAALLSIMAAAFASGGMGGGLYDEKRTVTHTPKTKEQLEREQIEFNKRKGLKEFNIDGCIVWAISRKNAIKKAKKSLFKTI